MNSFQQLASTLIRTVANSILSFVLDMKIPWFITMFSEQLRAPKPGTLVGWFALMRMEDRNRESSKVMVQWLDPKPSSVVVEIGPGHGMALESLLKEYQPSRVYGIEISEAFRQKLQSKFAEQLASGLLSIHNHDAKHLPFLHEASVDYIYALNVIYFLNPLSEYLAEIYRILKPGGTILFGISTAVASVICDPTYFVNTDWDACTEAIKLAGFENVVRGEGVPRKRGLLVPISAQKPMLV